MIPNAVLLGSSLSPPAYKVYSLLAHFSTLPDDDWPGQKGFADLAVMSVRSVRDATRELEAARLVHTYRRGLGRTNAYVLLTPRATPEIAAEIDQSRAAESAGQERQKLPLPRARGNSTAKTKERSGANAPDLNGAEPQPAGSDPPPLVRINGRDIAFDAISSVCGIDPSSPRAGEVAVALNGNKRTRPPTPGIRALFWLELQRWAEAKGKTPASLLATLEADEQGRSEEFEGALQRTVPRKARLYAETLKGATLTPGALAKWWLDLELQPERRDGGLTPEQILQRGAGA